MNKRALLLSLFVVGFSGLMPCTAEEEISTSGKSTFPSLLQAPAGFRFMVGDIEVVALSDGSIPLDCHKALTNIEHQKIGQLLDEANQKSPVETSINAFLLKMGDRIVLVDTGSGDIFGPKIGGMLVSALAANDVQPAKVTDILITHVHSDHSGGLVHGGERLFKNAKVHIGKPDVDFFLNQANAEKTGYDKHFFEQAIKTVKPYVDAGQVDAIAGDGAVIPGIKAVVIGGHTPGSTLYTAESNGERIVFTGDIMHVAAVQLSQPGTTIVYDVDPKIASANRKNYFEQWSDNRTLVAIPHANYPGVGYLKTDGTGFRWLPILYSNRMAD